MANNSSDMHEAQTSQSALPGASAEYTMLRDETMKRIDARNQIMSYNLVFVASMFTLALGAQGFHSALLVYPIVSFFFAVAFAYNSLMLIEIGSYLRGLESGPLPTGWAKYLQPRYKYIEPFEILSTSGLFLGTQIVAIVLYEASQHTDLTLDRRLLMISIASVVLTVVSIVYPVLYHRIVLRRDTKS